MEKQLEYQLNEYARHSKGCGANTGTPCTCGLEKVREEFFMEATRLRRAEAVAEKLFQACSNLCLDDMNKLEAEINEMSNALKEMEQPHE